MQDGEVIQHVIGARTVSGWWSWAGLIWIVRAIKSPFRVVVVTDRRIVVCKAGRFERQRIKEVIAEFPRSTKIGPAGGFWYRCLSLGERLYVSKIFHNEIAEADAGA